MKIVEIIKSYLGEGKKNQSKQKEKERKAESISVTRTKIEDYKDSKGVLHVAIIVRGVVVRNIECGEIDKALDELQRIRKCDEDRILKGDVVTERIF